jgi:hypothetical protein
VKQREYQRQCVGTPEQEAFMNRHLRIIWVIEVSKDGGASWDLDQSCGFYRKPERCQLRAAEHTRWHSEHIPEQHWVYRAVPYVPMPSAPPETR